MKCPGCKSNMKKVKFDIGYGIEADSLHCEKCGFNITDEKVLDRVISSLNEKIAKEVKVIEIGTGLGIRFPNEVVKNLKLKKGEEMIIKPEKNSLRLVPT